MGERIAGGGCWSLYLGLCVWGVEGQEYEVA